MIPLKLELKNFLSYGDTAHTVDFRGYSLICLSGKNGNGKSALLDAMTWAVWGQARKVSGTVKPDLGLLRLGQTRMMVSFEFEFNKLTYRVRREFAKTYGKPYAALDLDLFDIAQDKFVSLSEKTIRLTQAKIENLLGLDFATFVNSAFLRQGLANEFSQKTPKERKQILANILGLSLYDQLQQAASDNVKKFSDDKKLLIKLQEQVTLELQKEEQLIKDKQEQEKILKDVQAEQSSFQEVLENIEHKKNFFLKQKQEYNFLQEQNEAKQKQYSLKLNVLHDLTSSWKNVHYKALGMPDIKELENKKSCLFVQQKEFLVLQQSSLTLQEKSLHQKDLYQKKVNKLKTKLEKDLYDFSLRLEKKELERRQLLSTLADRQKLKQEVERKLNNKGKELLEIEKEGQNQKNFASRFITIQNQFEKRRSYYSVLVQKGNWLKTQLTDLQQRQCFVQNEKSPSCPLCEQLLTAKRKQFLGVKLNQDLKFLNYRLDRIKKLIVKLKELLLVQHKEYQELLEKNDYYKELLLKKDNLHKDLKQLNLDLKVIDKSFLELKIKEKTLSKTLVSDGQVLADQRKRLNISLQNDENIKDFLISIKELEQELKNLKYDKKLHLILQQELASLEKSLTELESLKQELSSQKDKRDKIKELILELRETEKLKKDFCEKIKGLKFDPAQEGLLELEIKSTKNSINIKIKEKDLLLQKMGSLDNELGRIQKLKKDNLEHDQKLKILEEEIEEYQVLVQSFGKNGIQALLIEESIPQIEEEANNILSRLTDNQAQVFIESLRDLKSGGVKETLDIQISDSAGIRPYEMFSGGEAFRVDFALRIAISKLLACRAGTALQTLIIDEGFGSQDEEGLGRLMDAIHAISKDFCKIIIVSHLTDFKDNFPSHFIVEKHPSGSIVRVEQRG